MAEDSKKYTLLGSIVISSPEQQHTVSSQLTFRFLRTHSVLRGNPVIGQTSLISLLHLFTSCPVAVLKCIFFQ